MTGSHSFDLTAGVVILAGPNGQGKTSLLDAILWSIVGSVPRLNASDEDIVSVYSETGMSRVELALGGRQGELRVIRSTDGEDQKVILRTEDESYEGAEAQGVLIRKLWPEAQGTSEPTTTLADALTRSVYLQQDVVRQFLEADDQEQFDTLAELVGVGRVTDLQEELENAKRKWTKVTNRREREEEHEVRDRFRSLASEKEHLASLAEEHRPIPEDEWDQWWTDASEFGVSVEDRPSPDSLEAASDLEGALNTLEARRRSVDRQLERGRRLPEEIEERPLESELPDIPQHVSEIDKLEKQLTERRDELEKAREKAAAERRMLVEEQEKSQEMAALSQLALRHLDDQCPVCTQRYDEEKTRARLESLIEAAREDEGPAAPDELSGRIEELASVVEKLDNKLSEAQERLRIAEEKHREHSEWIAERNERLKDLQIDLPEDANFEDTDLEEKLSEFIQTAEARKESIGLLEEQGEELSLSLATAGEVARREEIDEQIEELRKRIQELESWREDRDATGEYGQQIIEAIRGASSKIVEQKVVDLQPLLQSVFSRIDAHPTFREAELTTEMFRGRGRLQPGLRDPLHDHEIPRPTKVLSSSQVNSFAVSIFLAFNLGMPAVPLETVILDDPIQSLDDVNLLGLVDLLRRLETERQLVVSTHSERLAELLKRKLRPSGEDQRTLVIQFSGWSRRGPEIEQLTVRTEEPFSIVA